MNLIKKYSVVCEKPIIYLNEIKIDKPMKFKQIKF